MRLPTLLLLVLAGAISTGADPGGGADVGARVYIERCSGCHGDDGRGDGPAAAALVPKPRDFHSPALWRDRTLAQLRSIVAKGKPGTMMAPFAGVLSEAEIDAVVAFLARFDPARGSSK